jgi:hypothetical protein
MVRSLYMERLPYIDAYGVEVPAGADATWQALVREARNTLGATGDHWLARALGVTPADATGAWSPDLEPGVTLPGFAVERVQPAELLSLRGGHRFSRYRLDFELVAVEPGRTHVWARTWAEFPGLAGAAYRALVIGSGGHRLVVRRMLGTVARRAQAQAQAPATAHAGQAA